MDALGCLVILTPLVPLDESLFIPNIFTPNGDNVNETFFIRNLPDAGNELVITNRWGRIVFESNDYSNNESWDGSDVADGIYFYNLKLVTGESFSGWVEIWRAPTD
jgi:gliding motility-associated-like protein